MTETDLFTTLAETAFQAGRADITGELLRRRAVPALPPEQAESVHGTAVQHLQAGRWREAEPLLLAVIRARPEIGSWVDHLGVVYANLGRLPEAEVSFRLAARLEPTNASPVRNLMQCCFDQKKWPEAIIAIESLQKLEPANTELPLQMAVALSELKRYDEAEKLLLSQLAVSEKNAALWNRLGVVRGQNGTPEAAIECFQKQIALQPHDASGYANLAAAFGKSNRWAEAVEAGKIAVKLDPKNAGGWANLGNAHRDLGQLDEAKKALSEAIRLEPNTHESYGNFALTVAMNAQPREALAWYEAALTRKPDSPEIRFNRAIALLSLGDYANGWPEYEWRWRTEQMKGQSRKLPTPVWRGESLAGKTILIHTEQGHGDTIQFIKLLPRLKDLGAKVAVVTVPMLAELIATAPGVDVVVLSGEQVPNHQFHCPLMSLPLLTQLRLENIPTTTPYLTPDPSLINKWKMRLEAVAGPKIGIAWQGNPRHIGDRWRSVKLAQFAPLTKLGTLISLQKGFGSEQLENAPFDILDLGRELGDNFADTAGLLMNLDRIITIDSALAHLSGALARPVDILLPLNADWRWLHTRTDTPWYPTATLRRQKTFGDWAPVFAGLG
jgi:tetratricopeptide (TPR) repeat protein